MKKRPAQTCPECKADSMIGEEVHYENCKTKVGIWDKRIHESITKLKKFDLRKVKKCV